MKQTGENKMQRLTKQQIEYAKGRIYGSVKKQKDELKKSLTTGKPISSEDRANLIRTGKAKLKKSIKSISIYNNVVNCFDFSAYDEKFDEKAYNIGCDKIAKEAEKLMDELVLGDTQKALELISKLK
jgi:hypothetical protein